MVAVVVASCLGFLGVADDSRAACTLSGPDGNGVRTNTCTGNTTGRQQARGSNTEEKLILQSGATITNTTSQGQGILGRGDAVATKVTIETAGDINAATGIQFDMGRPGANSNGRSTLRITGGTISATGNGVSFNSRALGGFTFRMTGGTIGTASSRVGFSGLSAGIQGTGSTEAIDIDSDSAIYATQRGMSLTHAGTGTIDVDLTRDSIIDTLGMGNRGAGIWIARSGSGNIEVDNAGTIRSAGHDGIFVLHEADGDIRIDHKSGGRIEAANNGIYVRHGSADKGGTGTVAVISGGDITTTGSTGIFLDLNRGLATAAAPVSVSLTGGIIRAASTGVQVNSRAMGDLTFSMTGGSIGTAENRIGETGINLQLTNSANSNTLDVDLTHGNIYAVHRGLSLSHAGTGDIDLDIGTGSSINTQNSITLIGGRRLTRGAGVFASHSGSGDIDITNGGTINSGEGTGLQAWHNGTGNIVITNSGDITAGYQSIDARRFGRGLLTVNHNSGTITASRGPAIFARHDAQRMQANGYDVDLTIRGDVLTTDPVQSAVRAFTSGTDGNAGIRIRHQEGTITGQWGIFASSQRFSGSTYSGSDLASTRGYSGSSQPTILVEVGGDSGKVARIVARSLPGSDNDFGRAETDHQVSWVARKLVGTTSMPSAITVGGGDYLLMAQTVAAGDKDDTTITAEIREQFREVFRAAIAYQSDPNSLPLGNLRDPRNLVAGFSSPDLNDDDAIDAYLMADDNEHLKRFREFTLTEKEKAVMYAVFGVPGADLETALTALPASYDNAYKDRMRWYAGAYNDADFRVVIKAGGQIDSEGDGIRVFRRVVRDQNGASFVRIDDGATVSAGRYGVRARGAGVVSDGSRADQTVVVNGKLISTGVGGAGIFLSGGGRVEVGPKGSIAAASGIIIQTDGDSIVILELTLDQDEDIFTGGRRIQGRIIASDGSQVTINIPSGMPIVFKKGEGKNEFRREEGLRAFVIADTAEGIAIFSGISQQAKVYEALPSMLLGINSLPRYQARANAFRSKHKWWVSSSIQTGSHKPSDSTSSIKYGYSWTGVRGGRDFELANGDLVGINLHHHIGKSDVNAGGDIEATATGIGTSYTKKISDIYLDMGIAATTYDVDVSSKAKGSLASGVSAASYTVQFEVGGERKISEKLVQLNAGAAHTKIDADNFTDKNDQRITSISGTRTVGYAGARIEKPHGAGKLFGMLNVEADLGSKSSVEIPDVKLKSKDKGLKVRIGGGKTWLRGKNGSPITFGLSYVGGGGTSAIGADLSARF